MNYYIGGKGTLIDVACKCGLTSVGSVLRPWNPEVVNIGEFSRIYLIIREPKSRLLSAWRMYHQGPSIKWLEQGKHVDYIRDTKFIEKHAQRLLADPIPYFRRFVKESLADYQTDPHFAPQWREYRRFYLNHPRRVYLWNHRYLNNLFKQCGVEPVQLNMQKWSWPELSRDTLIGEIPQSVMDRYYIEDQILWEMVDK